MKFKVESSCYTVGVHRGSRDQDMKISSSVARLHNAHNTIDSCARARMEEVITIWQCARALTATYVRAPLCVTRMKTIQIHVCAYTIQLDCTTKNALQT